MTAKCTSCYTSVIAFFCLLYAFNLFIHFGFIHYTVPKWFQMHCKGQMGLENSVFVLKSAIVPLFLKWGTNLRFADDSFGLIPSLWSTISFH